MLYVAAEVSIAKAFSDDLVSIELTPRGKPSIQIVIVVSR